MLLKVIFEQKFLYYTGFSPEFQRCVRCGRKPRNLYFFNIQKGGVLCLNCKGKEDFLIPKEIPPFFQFIKNERLPHIIQTFKKEGIRVFPEGEIFQFSAFIFEYFFEKELKSKKILEESFTKM